MRRLAQWSGIALLALILLCPAGCKSKRNPTPRTAADDGQPLSMLQVADPRAAPQLTKGFYPVEGNAWRWTAHDFAVILHPPANAEQKGARLVLKFALPDAVIEKVHSVRMSATVNGKGLPSEEYREAGDHTYAQDVPAGALSGDAVLVDFTLDHYLPPTPQDQRELGIVVSTVGFESK